ncbi:CBS domain-containing protein [Candidatus Micrarchaeota archaeon]|nr:CBS domain-containing protein [Candidatus Micrarchaeota archaeon]MBU1166615.1 CBS domain-containing protein [Candidatus Micrarchaeota archaeon]MBU1886658.1 CBS domain-containing protein [Candidatus Micrarchaeota archaeon]
MEIKTTLILDSGEPLSKAISHLNEMPAVIVTKKGKYYGIIDHRSIGNGARDPNSTKCESCIVKPPVLSTDTGVLELVNAFLLGHFKALPVVDSHETPLGVTTRVELLSEMINSKMMPNAQVSELMNSPVYAVNENDTIGSARTTMKDKNARRLIVTKNGNPIGIVSTFDIGMWTGKSNLSGGRMDIYSDKNDIDKMELRSFLRPDVTVVEGEMTVESAAKKMVQKHVSGVVVTSDGKAVGVLSAIDIFKTIQDLVNEGTEMQISGLGDDNAGYYEQIKTKISHVTDKFAKTFNIRNCHVHVNEEKSVFTVSINFETDTEGHISLKTQRTNLKETLDELADELDTVLRKMKDKKKAKPRATSYPGGTHK